MKYLLLLILCVACGQSYPAQMFEKSFAVCKANEGLKEVYIDEDAQNRIEATCVNGAEFRVEREIK